MDLASSFPNRCRGHDKDLFKKMKNSIFKTANIIADYQTPVSVSMHSGTTAQQTFSSATNIKSVYIR